MVCVAFPWLGQRRVWNGLRNLLLKTFWWCGSVNWCTSTETLLLSLITLYGPDDVGRNFLSNWWSSLLSKHNTKSPSLNCHFYPLQIFASSWAFCLFCLISTRCRDCRRVSSSLSNCINRASIFSFAENYCSKVIFKVGNSIFRGSVASGPYMSSKGVGSVAIWWVMLSTHTC